MAGGTSGGMAGGTSGGTAGGTSGGMAGGTSGGMAGGVPDGGLTDGGSPDPYRAFLVDFTTAYCTRLSTCGVLPGTSIAECASHFAAQFELGARLVDSPPVISASARSVRRGTATFNPAVAAACLASVNQLFCSGPNPEGQLLGCAGITTSSGSACQSAFDCPAATSCNGPLCSATCSAGGNLGEGCLPSATSSLGTCNGSLVCAGGLCVPPPAPGSACFSFLGCGAASRCIQGACVALPAAPNPCLNGECAPNAFCDGTVCAVRRALGGACQSREECAAGLFCNSNDQCAAQIAVNGSCATQTSGCVESAHCAAGVCRANRSVGGPCQQDRECLAGLACDAVVRTCQTPTFVGSGQPCTNVQSCGIGTERCRGLRPNADGGVGTPGTCGVTGPTDSCRDSSDCSSRQYCAQPSRTCQPASLGTSCFDNRHCRATEYCNSQGTCAASAASGQLCDAMEPTSCVSLLERCFPGAGGQSRCQRLPTLGQTCSATPGCEFPFACGSGTCSVAGRIGQPCLLLGTSTCLEGECALPDAGLAPVLLFDVPSTNFRCAPPRADGQLCWTDRGCQSGWCDQRGEAPGVCVAACN